MNVSVHDVRHALNELGKLRFGEMRVEDAMHHIVQSCRHVIRRARASRPSKIRNSSGPRT